MFGLGDREMKTYGTNIYMKWPSLWDETSLGRALVPKLHLNTRKAPAATGFRDERRGGCSVEKQECTSDVRYARHFLIHQYRPRQAKQSNIPKAKQSPSQRPTMVRITLDNQPSSLRSPHQLSRQLLLLFIFFAYPLLFLMVQKLKTETKLLATHFVYTCFYWLQHWQMLRSID